MSLNGFLIRLYLTTESRLEVEIDCSHIEWSRYRDFIYELEDLLHSIDEKYSARSWLVKGRGLKARYRRVTSEDRRRKIVFSPFPSKFQNILKNTRGYMYRLVSDMCILLESVGGRNIYFLPKHLAPFFVEAVDMVNSGTIDRLRKEMDEFKASEDFMSIKRLLYSYGIDPAVLDREFAVGYYVVDLIPVDFGYSVDKDAVYESMDRERIMRGLEAMRKQIERKHREYVLRAVDEIARRIVEIAEAASTKGRRVRDAGAKLDRLANMCRSIGMEDVSREVIEPLRKILSSKPWMRKDMSVEIFGTENLKEGVEKALEKFRIGKAVGVATDERRVEEVA